MPCALAVGDLARRGRRPRLGSMPNCPSPISASPESFSRMRLKRGRVMCGGGSSSRIMTRAAHAFMARARASRQLPSGRSIRSGDRLGLASCRRRRRLRRRSRSAFFSMPSPSWKRTKPFSVIGAPASLRGGGDDVGDRGLVVHHEQLLTAARSPCGTCAMRALDHLRRRCSAACRFPSPFRSAIARSRSISSPDRARRRRAPAGWRRRRASRSACRARSSASAGAALSSATSTPILPRPGATGVVDVGHDRALRRPRARAARRSDWFSPIVAILSVSFSSTVPPPG